MVRGDDIEERLIEIAVRVLRLCEALPHSPGGRHIRGQLLRCGSAAASNYAEARGAESGRDFVHKLRIVLKELNETRVWLKMIRRAEMLTAGMLDSLLNECEQLCRIIGASIQTARRKR